MNGLYQGKLRKPATGAGAAGFPLEATPMTQMMNPGQPIQITYKFQPTGGGSPQPTAQPISPQPQVAQPISLQPQVAQPIGLQPQVAQPIFESRLPRQTAQPIFPGRMQPQPIIPRRPQEFWEREQEMRRAQPKLGEIPPMAEPPGEGWRPDWTGLQEQALRPLWEKFLAESERMQSMLSARGMGRSGALEVGEQEKWAEFMKEAGPVMADIAMREEELATKDRWFEREMELEWEKLGLSKQEIEDKKEMFYAELKQNEQMFNREYTLKETVAMDKMKQEWKTLGLTEQEMEQEMYKFDQQLGWEKERFGVTLEWEQRKAMEELALKYKELAQAGEISWQQLANDMTKFNAALEQTAWIEREKIRIQEEQMDLEDRWRWGQITIDQYNAETARLDAENRSLADWARIELDRWKTELSGMEVFGYYDEAGNYHKGTLDLKEWEIYLNYLLGLQGVTPEGEEYSGPDHSTIEEPPNLPGDWEIPGWNPPGTEPGSTWNDILESLEEGGNWDDILRGLWGGGR